MRLLSCLLLPLLLWMTCGNARAQDNYKDAHDFYDMGYQYTHWGYSWPGNTGKPSKGFRWFQVFRKFSDHTMDSSYSNYSDLPSPYAGKPRSGDPAKNTQVPLDSIVIVMRIANPKDFGLVDRYVIAQNGQRADSGLIRQSKDKAPYVLSYTTSSRGQKIDIGLYDKNGKSFGVFYYEDCPLPFLVTPFFREQEPAFRGLLKRIQNRDTILSVPKVNWKRYELIGPLKTVYVRERTLLKPTMLDVPRQYQPIRLLMRPLADTLAYEFQVVPDDIDVHNLPWQSNVAGDPIIVLPKLKPGNYLARIRYNRFNSEIRTYHITIRPRSYRYFLMWAVLGGATLLLMAGALLLRQKLRYRRRERRLKADRQLANLQNQVYRSQLNPHFIFNALSSIQSLMNKGETVKANDYLSDFALLLRQTLDAQKSAFWTLDDELHLLLHYIKLEQLRFPFRLETFIEEGLAPVNHPFPAMLLQPVTENAIRHGLPHDGTGILSLSLQRKGQDLMVVVKDNGAGFEVASATEGDGLRLTRERLEFISRHQGQPFSMIIQGSLAGTAVTFIAKEYFQDDEHRA